MSLGAPPPRVCPRCGEEYVGTVEFCAECGAALALPGEVPDAEHSDLPASDELVRVRVENPVWIEMLAERLAAEGIASRVEILDAPAPRRGGAPCALYVKPEDAERAQELDQELLRDQIPDLPEGANAGWSEAESCPACGAAVDLTAPECSECGLAFGEPEE